MRGGTMGFMPPLVTDSASKTSRQPGPSGFRIDAGTRAAFIRSGAPALLRNPFRRVRLHPRRVHRLVSKCLHLPHAARQIGERPEAFLLPELRVSDSVSPQ